MSYNQHYQQQVDRKQMTKQFNEANSLKKAANDTQFFWDMVNKNKYNSYHNNPKKPSKQEERILFGKKAENTERGEIDDNIPVERSGPQSEEAGVLQSFAELEGRVPPYVSANIALMKYEKPTPIQKHSIPLGLAGLDLMCCAQTGSGKTFAFLLPVVARLDAPKEPHPESAAPTNSEPPRASIDNRGALPRCIILAPTRELASQIHLDARRLIYTSRLKAVCVYGGNDLRTQLVDLSTGCDIIVATPGRLNDLVDRGCVSLSEVIFFVLDEADRMLDMGFEPQIRRIVADYDMPSRENRQTFMFSATFPPEIQTLAREFLRSYVWVGVGRVGSTVENIKQNIVLASSNPNDKMRLLIDAINSTEGRTLVFVQKRMTATWLCQTLNMTYRINADEIHGDRTQSQREHALRNFRDGYTRILVATDVAARGLDVPAVTHVIQFDMPQSAEDFDVYVHRIGRTGRAGKSGVATSFYVPGREVGEGNGKIASLILRLLQENKQDIPEWFLSLDDLRFSGSGGGGGGGRFGNGYRRPYNNSGGYQSSYNSHSGGQKFGWRDVRNFSSSTMYAGSASGSAGGGRGVTNGAGAGYDQGYSYHRQQQPPQQQHSPHGQSYHHYQQGDRGGGVGYYEGSGRSGYAAAPTAVPVAPIAVPYQGYSQPPVVSPHPGYEQDMYAADGYTNGAAYIPQQQSQYDAHMMQSYDPQPGAYYNQYTGAYVDALGDQLGGMTLAQQHSPVVATQQQPQLSQQWVVPPPVTAAANSPVPMPAIVRGGNVVTNGYRSSPPAPLQQQMHAQAVAVAGGYAYSHHPLPADEATAATYHQYGGANGGATGYAVNGHYSPTAQGMTPPTAGAGVYTNGHHVAGVGYRGTPLVNGYSKYANAAYQTVAAAAVTTTTATIGNGNDVMKDPQNLSA